MFKPNQHQSLDARSLAMHRLAVAKVRQHPELIERIANNLNRWRSTVSDRSLPYINAWQALLDQGSERLLSFAIEDSERATAMRQSSPFAGVLTPQERWQFLREWKEMVWTPPPARADTKAKDD